MRIQGQENVIYAVLEIFKILSVAVFLVGLRALVFFIQSYMLYVGSFTYRVRHIGHDFEWLLEHLTVVNPAAPSRAPDEFKPLTEHNVRPRPPHLSGPTGTARLPYAIISLAMIFGLATSIFDVGAFLLLDTEGLEVTNKPEYTTTRRLACSVLNPRIPEAFSRTSLPPALLFTSRRLPDTISKFGSIKKAKPFRLTIPDRVDYLADEKWRVNNVDSGKYSTIEFYDYEREILTTINRTRSFLIGKDSQHIRLRAQRAPRWIKNGNFCAGNVVGARVLSESNNTWEFCYSDVPRRTSCKGIETGKTMAFTFRCSKISLSNGTRKKTSNDLNAVAGMYGGKRGGRQVTNMLSLNRARVNSRFQDISPAIMIVARHIAELNTLYEIEERNFYMDTTVVIIPDFLVIVMGCITGFGMFLIVMHGVAVRFFRLVPTSNWPTDLLAKLTNAEDSLNRRRQRRFDVSVVCTRDQQRPYDLRVQDCISEDLNVGKNISVDKIG